MTSLKPDQEKALEAMRSRRETSSAGSLSEEEKARIRAEETYRAEVRGEVARTEQRQNAPGYWTGFILNLLVFGLGFFVIGEVVWGVVWLIGALVLNLSTSFISWPFLAVGVLIHYRMVYARKYS